MMAQQNARLNPDNLVLRIGIIGTGLVLWQSALNLWLEGQPILHPLSIGVSFVVWIIGTISVILALANHIDSRLAWLVPASLVVMLLVTAYFQAINTTPLTTLHTDNEMITEFAAQTLKRGENPYTWNYTDMQRVFRDAGPSYTSFLDGAHQNRVTYPALPVLMLLGFDLLGLGQVRTISLLFHILLIFLVFTAAPKQSRIIFLLPLVLLKEFILFSLGGVQDIVWSTLLVGVIIVWQRPLLRAILFGLACAFRQQPWFVTPFLLIFLWNEPGNRQERWRRVLFFAGISSAVFVGINLPFIVWDPLAWALGAFEPVYARFDVISEGIAALTQYGIAPFTREFYTVLQISFYFVMLIIHWRHPRAIGQAFWVFPGIFFWLYYRGLPNYWIYWIPPLLVAFARFLDNAETSLAPQIKQSSRAVTAALVVPYLFLNLLWGLFLLQLDASVRVDYAAATETIFFGETLTNRIRLSVTNKSDTVLFPRFAAQRDSNLQALPWTIESGPERLDPGQSGTYVIAADRVASRAIPARGGGQIILTDAGGNYWLRAVLQIPPEPSRAEISEPRTPVSNVIAHPDVYYTNLGNTYRRQRNFDLADSSYLKALVYGSKNPDAYFGLGESKFWNKDYVAAIEAFQRSIALGYDQPALAHRGVGWSQFNLKKFDDARQSFEQALRLAPDFADAYNGLGWAYAQSGACDKAIANFWLALRLEPNLPNAESGFRFCQR